MPQTFLQHGAKALVLLHAAASILLVGTCTHQVVLTLGGWRGRAYNLRLGRIYAAVVGITYAITFAFGALAYPTYRYWTRGLYLDRYAVWASNLFDIKENLASLALPMALGAWALSRVMDPQQHRPLFFGYSAMVMGTALVVWFNVIAGLLITMTRGV
jgi:hypothetical protein